MDIISAMKRAISTASRVGLECHNSVLGLLEDRIGFEMPYNSKFIADAFEFELAEDDQFSGLETFVHFLQCPLRTLCGKMKGSRTGAYHQRNEDLMLEG